MFLRFSRPQKAQEVTRDQLLDFSKTQRSCDVKNRWVQSSDRRAVRKQTERIVSAALLEQDCDVEERRKRLQRLLQEEEVQLLQEIQVMSNKETPEERQAKMAARAKTLRDKRESERQRLVEDKLEQLFREQSQELRNDQSRQLEQHVCADRAGQLRSRHEQLERLRQEDDMFNRLWVADGRAKEEREEQREKKVQRRDQELLKELKIQMEASEEQRRREKALKEEEAQLLKEQLEVHELQKMREQHQKLQLQLGRRQQLDQSLQAKMQRAREEQDELQADPGVLKEQQSEWEDRAETTCRKERWRAEQLGFIQYVAEQRRRQEQQDEEAQRLQEQQLQEIQLRREEQERLERDARCQLKSDVMEAHRLQVAHKRRELLLREAEETRRRVEEMKLTQTDRPSVCRRSRTSARPASAQRLPL